MKIHFHRKTVGASWVFAMLPAEYAMYLKHKNPLPWKKIPESCLWCLLHPISSQLRGSRNRFLHVLIHLFTILFNRQSQGNDKTCVTNFREPPCQLLARSKYSFLKFCYKVSMAVFDIILLVYAIFPRQFISCFIVCQPF